MSGCRCPEGPYFGAQLATEPTRCERCRLLVDEVSTALWDELCAKSLAKLEQWAKENPL